MQSHIYKETHKSQAGPTWISEDQEKKAIIV